MEKRNNILLNLDWIIIIVYVTLLIIGCLNIFSVTRQVHFSTQSEKSLDLVISINGLPVITFELKNELTKQNVKDAIKQYKTTRDPKEELFRLARCLVHFAVDTEQVWMCTHLKGDNSFFLPFNKGNNNGAGNPPNPSGIKTDSINLPFLV